MSETKRTRLTADDAAAIARLARLAPPEESLDALAGQFNAILEYMDALGQLDTSGVEPLYSPTERPTPYREDRAEARATRDKVLANAPETDGKFFIVPRIV